MNRQLGSPAAKSPTGELEAPECLGPTHCWTTRTSWSRGVDSVVNLPRRKRRVEGASGESKRDIGKLRDEAAAICKAHKKSIKEQFSRKRCEGFSSNSGGLGVGPCSQPLSTVRNRLR